MASVHQYPTLTFFILLLLHPIFLTTPTEAASSETDPSTSSTSAETQTKLQFYFHDIVSGTNPTAVTVARPDNQTKVGFGTLVMIDDPLTEGPDEGSKEVGRAEGMYGQVSQTESTLFMSFTFSFKGGQYDGSSLSILGRYQVDDAERELPVIGGSGVFRMARGYALAKTYKYDPNTGDATSEYNVFVRHSETSSGDRLRHFLLFSALCSTSLVLIVSHLYAETFF